MELLVLDHHRNTGLCRLADVLDATPDVPHRVVPVTEQAVPDGLDDLAGIVTMGGPQSATQPESHPWMHAEVELLARAVDRDVPVFAVCLGAQLLGHALGGEVTCRPVPEIGYLPLTRTPAGVDDEVTGDWPDGTAALFVHEDEVTTLPEHAVPLLEGNDGVPAWRVGSGWAIQAHPEVDAAQLARWAGLDRLRGLMNRAEVDPDRLVAEGRHREAISVVTGPALLRRFLDGPVRRRLRRDH